MSTTPRHPHADIIKAWLDGAEIEVKANRNGSVWHPYYRNYNRNLREMPAFNSEDQYRIKPKTKTVYYRNALFHAEDFPEPWVSACYNKSLESSLERGDSFIRWLGDWQSVEVEVE